jgi:hypothetical protein
VPRREAEAAEDWGAGLGRADGGDGAAGSVTHRTLRLSTKDFHFAWTKTQAVT